MDAPALTLPLDTFHRRVLSPQMQAYTEACICEAQGDMEGAAAAMRTMRRWDLLMHMGWLEAGADTNPDQEGYGLPPLWEEC